MLKSLARRLLPCLFPKPQPSRRYAISLPLAPPTSWLDTYVRPVSNQFELEDLLGAFPAPPVHVHLSRHHARRRRRAEAVPMRLRAAAEGYPKISPRKPGSSMPPLPAMPQPSYLRGAASAPIKFTGATLPPGGLVIELW